MLLIPGMRVNVIMARTLYQLPNSTVKAILSSPKHGWVDQVSRKILHINYSFLAYPFCDSEESYTFIIQMIKQIKSLSS